MPLWDEEKEALNFVYEQEIKLYDSEEAGKTCQKIVVNGKEVSIHEFKRNKRKQEKPIGHSWLKKHGFEPSY